MARKQNIVATTPFATTLLQGMWPGNYFLSKRFSDEIRVFSDEIDSLLKLIFVVVQFFLTRMLYFILATDYCAKILYFSVIHRYMPNEMLFLLIFLFLYWTKLRYYLIGILNYSMTL